MADLAHAPSGPSGSGGSAQALRGERPQPSGTVHASFLPAGQSDMIRAAQKDDYFVQRLRDTLLDVSERMVGPQRTMAWEEEVSLASAVLYYGLTTGAGTSTLGEEYCDLHMVAGATQRPLFLPRRGLLVLLQTVVPYALQRERRLAASAVPVPHVPSASIRADPDASALTTLAESAKQLLANARASARRVLPHIAEPLEVAARAHLALFYLYGTFLTPAHRAAGARHMFIGTLGEPRARFAVLGVLLAAQVAIQCAQAARSPRASMLGSAQPRRHTVLLDASGNATPLVPGGHEESAPAGGTASSAAPTCALCLSPRQSPTATPCGHVFCWSCVAGWTATQPRCPLCRAPAKPQDLAPLHNMP